MDDLVFGIGGIPKTYLESLTYEQQLLWFSKNLQDVMDNMNSACSVDDYESLIDTLNETDKDEVNAGQTFHIQTQNVPDLFISEILDSKTTYTYTTDEAIVEALKTTGYIVVGYFKIMSIEALTDLSDYFTKEEIATLLADYIKFTDIDTIISEKGLVKNTDYATSSVGGVIKASWGAGQYMENGALQARTITSVEYATAPNTFFIGKGTLENVLTGKGYETTSNKVTSLSSSSTDTEYPSAKCVYDIVGNIESLLGGI